jgi:hypothetical protein
MKATKYLSPGNTNAKTAKNSLKTFIMYLTPGTTNGVNLCPKASKNCLLVCLHTAGLAGIYPTINAARLAKTEQYLKDKPAFIRALSYEIMKQYNKAKKNGEQIAIRLNGTTDVDFIYLLQKYAGLDIATLAPVVYFYDYTKILQKAIRYQAHPNYTVTFSRSESNQAETETAIKLGINVAAVFSGDLPATYLGAPVIDGDKSDILMIYNKGAVLGLKAKGRAKKDASGFVIQTK